MLLQKKLIGLLLFVSIALIVDVASAYTVQGLKCSAGSNGPAPSSFILYRKQPGETVYSPFLEQPNCDFASVDIVDTGETCFKYAAKNAVGTTVRNDTTICVNPLNATLPPPNTLGVK